MEILGVGEVAQVGEEGIAGLEVVIGFNNLIAGWWCSLDNFLCWNLGSGDAVAAVVVLIVADECVGGIFVLFLVVVLGSKLVETRNLQSGSGVGIVSDGRTKRSHVGKFS